MYKIKIPVYDKKVGDIQHYKRLHTRIGIRNHCSSESAILVGNKSHQV